MGTVKKANFADKLKPTYTLYMKKIFVFLLSVMMAQNIKASSYAYPYLNIVMTDNTSKTFSVESLTMTPVNGTLRITNAEGSETLNVTELSKMYFSEDVPNAIGTASADAEQSATITLCTITGIVIGNYSSINAAHDAMQPGTMYIVKKGNKTVKTIRK